MEYNLTLGLFTLLAGNYISWKGENHNFATKLNNSIRSICYFLSGVFFTMGIGELIGKIL